MQTTMQQLGIDQLSAERKLELIGEIWDSLNLPLSPIPASHREELDRRIAKADAEPGSGKPWDEFLASLRDKK